MVVQVTQFSMCVCFHWEFFFFFLPGGEKRVRLGVDLIVPFAI